MALMPYCVALYVSFFLPIGTLFLVRLLFKAPNTWTWKEKPILNLPYLLLALLLGNI